MKSHHLHALVCAATGLLGTATTTSAQLVFQPLTEQLSKDTKIYQHVPTSNFSSNLNLTSNDVGSHFLSLLQFDLTQYGTLEASAITSAYLTLSITGLGISGAGAVGGDVSLSPILSGWRENAADAGSDPLATYNAFFGPLPTITFGSAVATTNVTGPGFYTWDITSTVQSWVNGTLPNNGLLIQLTSSGGDIGIASATSAGAANAPSLTVVPEPGANTLLGGVGLFYLMRRRPRARIA